MVHTSDGNACTAIACLDAFLVTLVQRVIREQLRAKKGPADAPTESFAPAATKTKEIDLLPYLIEPTTSAVDADKVGLFLCRARWHGHVLAAAVALHHLFCRC